MTIPVMGYDKSVETIAKVKKTPQLEMVTLKCPNCGGVLEIHSNMEHFACGYCGSQQIVERRGGTIGLRLIADAVTRVQAGTDRTAAELALVRLDKELATLRAVFHRENQKVEFLKPNSSTTILIILPICLVIGCFGAFVQGLYQGDVATVFLSVLIGGASILGFFWAVKQPAKARERYDTLRSEIWNRHGKGIEDLEKQIDKHRRMIHS